MISVPLARILIYLVPELTSLERLAYYKRLQFWVPLEAYIFHRFVKQFVSKLHLTLLHHFTTHLNTYFKTSVAYVGTIFKWYFYNTCRQKQANNKKQNVYIEHKIIRIYCQKRLLRFIRTIPRYKVAVLDTIVSPPSLIRVEFPLPSQYMLMLGYLLQKRCNITQIFFII